LARWTERIQIKRFGHEEWSASTKDAIPTLGRRTQATIYADEKAMGREKEKAVGASRITLPVLEMSWVPHSADATISVSSSVLRWRLQLFDVQSRRVS